MNDEILLKIHHENREIFLSEKNIQRRQKEKRELRLKCKIWH